MELIEQKSGSLVLISISGRLDTTTYPVLENKFNELFDKQEFHLLIDCGEMIYISSSGLRIFLIGLKRIAREKGRLALCSLQPTIREIFEVSGFTSIFEIYGTKEEALNAMTNA